MKHISYNDTKVQVGTKVIYKNQEITCTEVEERQISPTFYFTGFKSAMNTSGVIALGIESVRYLKVTQ